MDRIVIIDGNSLINRAYYAMQRPMITKTGIYTQGIYGFLNMLNRILEDYVPEYIAVAWDKKAPTFRHKEYKEYKAGRKKMPPELAMQLPLIKEVMNAMKITNLEAEGFEADDIIGTVARIAEEEGLKPLIITGDKDALQLCGKVTEVLITRRGISEFDLFDHDKMLERYELTPSQFVDLKGLMGDSSDNIPGIPGVGEKTGIKLLKQFGTVENLVANTEEISNAKLRSKVEDNVQLALLSRKLAEINRFVPIDISIENFRTQESDRDELIAIYTKLEFNSFLKKLSFHDGKSDIKPSGGDETEYRRCVIRNSGDLTELRNIEEGSTVILKVFGNNDHVNLPVIDGISMITGDRSIYVSLDEIEIGEVTEILNDKNLKFVGHELIRDYFMLMSHGMKSPNTEFDTAIAAYVLNPSQSNYNIKTLTFEELHEEIISEEEFRKNAGQIDMLGDNIKEIAEYGLLWCKNVKALHKAFNNRMTGDDIKICDEIEFPLIKILADMEVTGITADVDILRKQGDELKREIAGIEQEIHNLAGETFNVNSPMQLGKILFEKLGLPAGKKTKKGYSTSAETLEKISSEHPIIPQVLRYRTVSKINGTYVEGLIPLIGFDGKIRAHFQQTVAATGRLSCTEPNLQNIPVREEMGRRIRKAFVPEDGHVFVGADYSQIELRIMAHLSQDENLINSFNNGDDVHRMTASRVFDIDYDKVTPLDRSRAKAVNFGVIYGMSAFGLSEELGITRRQAEQYIEDYFKKHEAVKSYLDERVKLCRQRGYTETIFGRKRYVPEISASNYMTRQFGERLAMNTPIQGSAADVIKIAMQRVFRALEENYPKAKLVLQIHDELIISTEKEDLGAVKKLLTENMEEAVKLSVRLICDVNSGSSWYDLKD